MSKNTLAWVRLASYCPLIALASHLGVLSIGGLGCPSESLAVVVVGYRHRGGCSLGIGLVLLSRLVPTGVQWSAVAVEKRGKRSRATVLARLLDSPCGSPTTWVSPSCLLLTSPSISRKSGPHPAGEGRGSRLCEMRVDMKQGNEDWLIQTPLQPCNRLFDYMIRDMINKNYVFLIST